MKVSIDDDLCRGHAVRVGASACLIAPYLPGRWKVLPWALVALGIGLGAVWSRSRALRAAIDPQVRLPRHRPAFLSPSGRRPARHSCRAPRASSVRALGVHLVEDAPALARAFPTLIVPRGAAPAQG